MTPQYILEKSLCRPAHCFSAHILRVGYVPASVESLALADAITGTLTAQAMHRQRMEQALSEIENMNYAQAYAEPGYSDPEKGILFADWNIFPRGVDSILEAYGYAIEWQDEWTTCGNCSKAVRTSADSYDWQPSYTLADGELTCNECQDWPAYLESIEDNANSACVAACDPSEHGYERISDKAEYENGWHEGMNDDPRKILKALQAKGYEHIVFRISETSQFYITFEVWQRKDTEA